MTDETYEFEEEEFSTQFNGQTMASIAGNGSAPNPNLQPFTVTEREIGLEGRLFNNRLHFDLAGFDKKTTDQILEVNLSTASGYNNSTQNLGSLKNSGLESLIEYTAVQTRDFSWTTSWNNTYLKTKVLAVGKNPDGTPIDSRVLIYFNGTGNEFLGELVYTVGMPMNEMYTRTFKRNDQGQILVNTFKYKKLTLGVFIDYKLGGTVLSSTLLNMTRQGFSKLSLDGRRDGENGIIFPGINEGTGKPNTVVVSDLQSFYADYRNLQIGDPFTFKSDFVKLRTISLSYDFTDEVRSLGFLGFVKGLSLTASCRNVLLLYKDLPNLDPESMQSSGDFRAGYEDAAQPTTRNYMFTLNAKF